MSAPDPAPFALRCAEALRAALRQGEVVVVDPLQLEITHGEHSVGLSLAGAWRQRCRAPEAEPRLIAAVTERVLSHLEGLLAPTAEDVLPVLRGEALALQRMIGAAAPLGRPLCPGLWVSYAFDLPTTRRMLRRSDADQLALSDARLDALALANLRALARELTVQVHAPGLLQVQLDGDNDAALLLLDHLWSPRSGGPLGGGPLSATAAADGALLVVVGDDRAREAQMMQLGRRLAAQQLHALPPLLLRRRAGAWQAAEGGPDAPTGDSGDRGDSGGLKGGDSGAS